MKMNLAQKLFLLIVAATTFQTAIGQPVTLTQIVVQATPKETLTSTTITMQGTSQLRFDVLVVGTPVATPTGSVTFTLTPEGTNEPLRTTLALVSGVSSWVVPSPVGSYSISAAYSGDVNYRAQGVTSNGTGGSLPPDFDLSAPAIRIKQGETWSGTVQVIPLNGFSQALTVTCLAPSELKCDLPVHNYTVVPTDVGRTRELPLSITTFPGQFAASLSFFLLPLAFGIRARQLRRLSVGIGFSVVILAVSGCGGGSGAAWQAITPKGTYHISIVGSSGGREHIKDITVIVE